ncbi:hypothetical protein AEAC466_13585 [Asticcacaulis sp. AC466]|uniref:SagB/ThcOx family dehydrogenase n=1 Tax=Asticcacaulis sp. AC466 TaxID=1282362 RepID=UPI0003C3C604|nr:SagB/ThcOx family dehydrogenase [Asticcacaulis sp. AC466]ESQ83278.1 hypothetical protein AEAC466_13585 [Asticcacaulis sp. AC466]
MSSAISFHHPSFDPDAEVCEALETAHELTRFHRATMPRRARQIARFLHDPACLRAATTLRSPTAADILIALPEAVLPDMSLAAALQNRRSARRDALAGGVELAQVSAILHMAVRANRVVTPAAAPDAVFHHRPYPSAGALYPCELYVIRPDAPPYRYDARRHCLVDYGQPVRPFASVEAAPSGLSDPCALVITAELARTTGKYGGRGYRFAALEAGHLSQNLLLAAAALGLPALGYGSYFDAELEDLLGVDPLGEPVMAVILLGGNTDTN